MPLSFRAITQWILCMLALGASLVFLPGLYDYANLPQGAVLQVGAALALTCALYGFRDEPISIGFFDVAVAAWIAWMSVSLLWTPDPDIGVNLLAQWLAAAGLAWAYSLFYSYIGRPHRVAPTKPKICNVSGIGRDDRCMRTDGFIEKILTMFFVSGVLVATIGALQFLLPASMAWIPVTKGPAAMFGNRNMAAEYLLTTLPLGWVFFLRARRPFQVVASALGCALIGLFFTYALSRTGLYFSAFQALLFLVLVVVKRTRTLLLPTGWTRVHTLALASALGVFMILANLTSNGFEWRWNSAAQDIEKKKPPLFHEKNGALPDHRTMLFQNTWEMAKDRPLAGFGLGSFKSVYPAYARSAVVDRFFTIHSQAAETHNDFLQFFAELGVIGITLFATLWVLFFRNAWMGLRGPHGAWCIGLGLAGVGLFLDAMVNFPMSRGPLPPFVFFMYGTLIRDRRSDWTWKPSPKIMSALSMVFALLLIATVYWNVTRLAADSHLETSLRAGVRQDWQKALTEIESARQLHPNRKLILFTAARIYATLGDKARAITTYEEGLKAYPYAVNELWNTGMGYMELNKLDDALTYCQKAIAILPDEASFQFHLGFLYAKRKEIDKAQAAFDEALRLDPGLTLVLPQ